MEPEGEMLGAVDEGIVAADSAELGASEARAKESEKNTVKARWEEYEAAREFDKEARAQYAVDRRYAAGTAHLDWAVSANLIGAFIDILVSFLYARNPDVSVKKAPRVQNMGTATEDDFAKTLELVVSSLWKSPTTRLKHAGRRVVRSVLSTGVGWVKAIVVSNGTNIPQLRTELNDARQNIAQLEAVRARLQNQSDPRYQMQAPEQPLAPSGTGEESGYEAMSYEKIDIEWQRMRELEASLSNRLEVAVRKGLAVDYVAPEDIQVSLDVDSLCDYVNARWIANAIYRPTDRLQSLFPRLTEQDARKAKCYYLRKTQDLTPLSERVHLTGIAGSEVDADEAERYTAGEAQPGDKAVAFAKIVELWDRETGHIHTMIDGIDRWAKEPYQPDYPTTRFFPYFKCAFYEVDGARHPQSLSWRLAKLMDEYSSTRSSLRLTRQRAVPGIMFNASAVSPEDARKIEGSTHQELIGIKPTNPEQALRDIFSEKPIAVGDMRLFDVSPIVSDMERISGVQEALSQSATVEKTATEAEIQQTGFASRTTADREELESMFTELAQYTAELALSALDMKDAQRIAGAAAYWPAGMSIDDLLTMVEVVVEAGTTGKPRSTGDRDTWGVVMPLIKASMLEIRAALMTGDTNMADALIALLQETMNRLGDDTDVTRFVPKPMNALPPPVPGAPVAGVPGAPSPAPGAAPPMAEGASPLPPDGGAPELTAPELTVPEVMAPPLNAPLVV